MSSFVDESASGGWQEGRGITFKDEKHVTKRARANGFLSDENMNELDMDNLDDGETENESHSNHTHKRSRWRPPDIVELFVALGVPESSVASYELTPSQLSFPVNAFEDGEAANDNSNSINYDGKSNSGKLYASHIRSNNMLLVGAESRTSIAKSTYRYFEKYLSQPAMNTNTSDDGTVDVKFSTVPVEDYDAMELDQEDVSPIPDHKNTSRRGIDSVRVYNTTGNNDNNPDTCVTEPSQDIIIRCVAAVIEAEIRGDESELNFQRNKELFPIFDLESDVSRDFMEKLKLADKNKDIMYAYIYYYLDWTSRKFCYSAEVNIIALAYVCRLTSASELTLTTCNWQNIWVTTVNLAVKMWQDVGLKSATVAQALRGLSKDHVREMEISVLRLIDYDTNISGSLYAKYYFSLREMYGELFPGTEIYWGRPLSAVSSKRLDARSVHGNLVKRGKALRNKAKNAGGSKSSNKTSSKQDGVHFLRTDTNRR